MIFSSKHSFELSKNAKEVTAKFKSKTGVEIKKKGMLEESKYLLEHDYNQFIIRKKTTAFSKNGFLEINLFLKVNEIDEHHSKIAYSIKFTALTVLIIVALCILTTAAIMFSNNFHFFGSSKIITSNTLRLLISLANLFLFFSFLKFKFILSKKKLEEVLEEIQLSLSEDLKG